jgi:hypothetical protein
MNLEVQLTNGQKHTITFDGKKEEFFDLLKFSRDTFLQDTEKNYFIVSSIMSFKIKGETNNG